MRTKKSVLLKVFVGTSFLIILIISVMVIKYSLTGGSLQSQVRGTYVSKDNPERTIVITSEEIEFNNIPFKDYEDELVVTLAALDEHNREKKQEPKFTEDEKKAFVDELKENIKWDEFIDSKVVYKCEDGDAIQDPENDDRIWILTDSGSEKEFCFKYVIDREELDLGKGEIYIRTK